MKVNILSAGKEGSKIKVGGIEVASKQLAKELRVKGVEVDYNGKEPANYYDIINVHFTLIPTFLKKIREQSNLVVHSHITVQDMVGGVFGISLVSPLVKRFLRVAYNQAPQIISVSEFAKKSIRQMGVVSPIDVISNGISLENFPKPTDAMRKEAKLSFCKKYQLNPDIPLVGGLGSLFPRKGVLDFRKVAELRPKYQFVWAGRPQLSYPKFFFNLYLGRIPANMKMLGFVDDLLEFYYALDVFLFPTFIENQGIPTLECSATLTPMVLRKIEVFDWLENTKSCLFGTDVPGFAQCIDRLLNENLTPKLTQRAFVEVQKHRLEDTVDQVYEVFKRQLDR